MPDLRCRCGYELASDDDLAVHLSEVLVPADDLAPDGVRHAERVPVPGMRAWACVCGFTAADPGDLDAHLLAAFTVPDGAGVAHGPAGRSREC